MMRGCSEVLPLFLVENGHEALDELATPNPLRGFPSGGSETRRFILREEVISLSDCSIELVGSGGMRLLQFDLCTELFDHHLLELIGVLVDLIELCRAPEDVVPHGGNELIGTRLRRQASGYHYDGIRIDGIVR